MKKINVAELLKDCPKGMELDCTMYNDVKFIGVEEYDKPICIRTGDIYRYLTKYGTWSFDESAKCVIFPKGKTTWEGFVPPCQFKDGDVLVGLKGSIFIFKELIVNDVCDAYSSICTSYCGLDSGNRFKRSSDNWTYAYTARFATKEEKETLFKAIKDNGYRWNAETKTLEELPKFKVGDMITNGKVSITIGYIDNNYYYEFGRNIANRLFIKNQDDWKLVPNKFDITTLKPFESRVLVKPEINSFWMPSFFGFYKKDTNVPFVCCNGYAYKYCIPYENNEHLLGTTDDCDEFYKTW